MKPKRKDGYEDWKARDGWRWRWWSKGRIVAESGEGYRRKFDMHRSLARFAERLIRSL